MSDATARLRVYRFAPGAAFEGGVLAAMERLDLGDEGQLLDALFVAREPATGELQAVDLAIGAADGTFAALLDFRLEPSRRAVLTERTLADHPSGLPRADVEALAATLEAGSALFALLHTGALAEALQDAVARGGGQLLADEPAAGRTLAEAAGRLRAAAAAGVTRSG